MTFATIYFVTISICQNFYSSYILVTKSLLCS